MDKDTSLVSLEEYISSINNIEKNQSNTILFSLIIPVYNVEDYIEETMESIINQNLDFEKYVQIVLVNDGSTDGSHEICEKYKNAYPNNVVYISKENGGVSSARNVGLQYAKGKYVNFVDPDDILSQETLLSVFDFFELHSNDIDLVAIPVTFFEARKGPHILNFKFDETRVIDVEEEPHNIQLSASSSFIKLDVAKSFVFNESLKYGEDAEFVNKIILLKRKYGVVTEGNYLYRIRAAGTSAIQNTRKSKDIFVESVEYFLKSLIDYSLSKYGYVPKYIQHVIFYDLQWKFKIKEISSETLNESEVIEFFNSVIPILSYIDDSVIKSQSNVNVHLKYFILKLKYKSQHNNCCIEQVFTDDDVRLYLNGTLLNSLKKQNVYVELINVRDNLLTIEGFFASLFDREQSEILVKVNDELVKTELVERPLKDTRVLGATVKKVYGFAVHIPIEFEKRENKISFCVRIDGNIIPINITLANKAPIVLKRPSYFFKDDLLITRNKKDSLIIKKNTLKNKFKHELRVFKYLFKKKNNVLKKVAIIRMVAVFLSSLLKKNKIYLFMDRIDKADDNAEVLFEYANNVNDNVKKYFIISNESKDVDRLKKSGKVVKYGSYYHRLLLLLADKLISSHADEVVLNPFGKIGKYYRDLFKYDFIFLQHGILQNDLSNWLNKYHKNIKVFVTSSELEKNAVVGDRYGYDENEVALTGLPRFDRLENKNQKEILIMPTWRKQIVGNFNLKGKREYNEDFTKSDYYLYYNKLINDPRVIEKAKEKGYNINFVVHPNISLQIKDFDKNEHVKIMDPSQISYRQLFNVSSLLITDYSSVAFDFAYLRKPILYYQFDVEEFHSTHILKGYFDYEDIGFGPVIYDYEALVNTILQALDNDCNIDEKYLNRINDFFAHSDRSNSARVYEKLSKL
ncbi:bifunctional glycosyltransferase/CDP-glycerol:glycerophosphate glycerophosphotransferase [Ornithinibacillus xuwenensis]|uniref:CDP-glycerol glycerophosphotransferase family protein n=1 Tax=Ornithinibacillus xuwenensis TaxID=3144668 RepID=A0ABU9XKJ6_9BACI